MYAVSDVEIVYVLLAFIITTVLSSVIMGEVINLCMAEDAIGKYVAQQRHLVECFIDHLQLNPDTSKTLLDWVELEAPEWLVHNYDRMAMKELIQGRYMSRELMVQLPARIYKG